MMTTTASIVRGGTGMIVCACMAWQTPSDSARRAPVPPAPRVEPVGPNIVQQACPSARPCVTFQVPPDFEGQVSDCHDVVVLSKCEVVSRVWLSPSSGRSSKSATCA